MARQTEIDDRISEIDEVLADCTRHLTGLDAATADCTRHMKELTGVRRQLMLRRADLRADVDFDTDERLHTCRNRSLAQQGSYDGPARAGCLASIYRRPGERRLR